MGRISFVTAEVGIEEGVNTYSGGLGILSGDILKSASRMGMPVDFYTLVYHKGYSRQEIDARGHQSYAPAPWNPSGHGFVQLDKETSVHISGRRVFMRPWVRNFGSVNLFLLDTNVDGNNEEDRALTDRVYDPAGGDKRRADLLRLKQGIVLGASVRMGHALGVEYSLWHLQEGFPALVFNELIKLHGEDAARELGWFTTHTPVPAAFDYIPEDLARDALGDEDFFRLMAHGGHNGCLSTSHLAARLSRGINAVSRKHAETCRSSSMDFIFGGREIIYVTNGVDLPTWVSEGLGELYSRRLGDWVNHPEVLNNADKLSLDEIIDARRPSFDALNRRIYVQGVEFDPNLLTIGFARRGAEYKRPELAFHDIERLATIARGNLQFVFAGKAHPADYGGQAAIERACEGCCQLRERGVNAVFLEDYSIGLALPIVQGCDVWINNPMRPLESSGTSGMKLAANGALNVSVLDGWWGEGYNGKNGFAIAPENHSNDQGVDARHLYDILEKEVVPLAHDRAARHALMTGSIRLGAYFNTNRVVGDYSRLIWNLERSPEKVLQKV
ncbi:alpha-glucan family phosphorylase [Candidatus Woesearchaeota archaeon]|nr:alpha-glucan family phosphorylase [Candidatus Woesearchaeota archaeon]